MNCPHCGKSFDKLAMLVDGSDMIRETYYACPHCKARVDLEVNEKALQFSGKGNVPSSESKCPYYFGYLSFFCNGSLVPETCLTCSKVTKCMTAKKNES